MPVGLDMLFMHMKNTVPTTDNIKQTFNTLHIYFSLATSFQHENYTYMYINFTFRQFESKSGMYHS